MYFYLAIWLFGYLAIWLFGYLAICLFAYLAFSNPVNNSVYLPFIKCDRLGAHRTQ